jgi:hypothetical protein
MTGPQGPQRERASFDTVAPLPIQDDENLELQNYSSS